MSRSPTALSIFIVPVLLTRILQQALALPQRFPRVRVFDFSQDIRKGATTRSLYFELGVYGHR